jgi:hypothetical protein
MSTWKHDQAISRNSRFPIGSMGISRDGFARLLYRLDGTDDMKFLSYLLFQIDEARRYIEDGRLEHLTLALLLLDNAAEIQMDRRIKAERVNDFETGGVRV